LPSPVGCSVMFGQPEQVRALGGEIPQHQVVVHRRPWLAVEAALAGVHRPDPLLCAEPVDPVAGGDHALVGELVGDEAVAELGVVVVDVDCGVDQVRVVPVALADGIGLPLVERLLGETQHPAGHRDGDVSVGEVEDQRVHHFGSTSRAK
jgi:hypothetical protein